MPSLPIVAGKFRRRSIRFPDLPNLRPTPIRIRETLFNWLMHDIVGAHCLDLFAGSGALSFEAYSRGASRIIMTENHRLAVKALKKNCLLFKAEGIHVYPIAFPKQADLLTSLSHTFNIVFLDPPFASDLLMRSLGWLKNNEGMLLAHNAKIYVESNQPLEDIIPPQQWTIIKQKKTGQVYYGLVHTTNTAGIGSETS